jgi:hypothetical protein
MFGGMYVFWRNEKSVSNFHLEDLMDEVVAPDLAFLIVHKST